jgi:ABC-type lipoprotein export system ATPase subunit
MILVTHDPAVAHTADRIVTMRDGLVIDDSKVDHAAVPPSQSIS